MGETSALVLFSGGQDSTTCLAWALDRFDRVETVGFDYRQRNRVELEARRRSAQHLRSGPQPAVPHLRRGARLSTRHRAPRDGRLRDRLFRLSRLPRRCDQGAAGRVEPRHGDASRHRDSVDVDRQGGDLAASARSRRRKARRSHPGGNPHLLRGRPRPSPRLGLWLRSLPGLRSSRRRLWGVPGRRLTRAPPHSGVSAQVADTVSLSVIRPGSIGGGGAPAVLDIRASNSGRKTGCAASARIDCSGPSFIAAPRA